MSGTLPGSAWSSCSTSAPSGISLKPSSAMLPTAASASRTLHAPSAPAAAFSMLRRSMRFLLGRVFYCWVIVAVACVTMAIGVNARTAFSLLFPPIVDEFGWDRGATAAAFSFGFILAALLSPFLGRWMDRFGPRPVLEAGVVCVAIGLVAAAHISAPWQLHATLGLLVGAGSVCLSYTGQSCYLPNWFVRRRGLAMSVAFSGVGVGSIVLFPALQALIAAAGWRTACTAFGIVVLV